MDANATKQWIVSQLNRMNLDYDKSIPTLIYQYNEGNLLACSQVIEKISLLKDNNKKLTIEDVQEHLSNQCDYSMYELADACLQSNLAKALLLIRQSKDNKTEPTLILWILAQEVRLLLQIAQKINQGIPFREAASQLKVWSNKIGLYQTAIKKMKLNILIELLQICEIVDRKIKSGQVSLVWRSLELLALKLMHWREGSLPVSNLCNFRRDV